MKKKNFIAIMASMFLVFGMQAQGVLVNGIFYNFSGTEAEVTSGITKYTDEIVIPSTVVYDGKTYNVTRIGEGAFDFCPITSITIPNSVTSIGKRAFNASYLLTSITIPESVTSIEEQVFQSCIRLISITLPNSLTKIGYEAFSHCRSLTSITIPSNVTSIGGNACWRCSSLTSIIIPSSVTSIGDEAFLGCISLTSITLLNPVPIDINPMVFDRDKYGNDEGVDKKNCILKVPASAVPAYKKAKVWKQFRIVGEK